MPKVNMHEAKTNFSKLVERALAGEEVVIARHGKPLVKLTPVEVPAGLRPVGLHRQPVSEAEAREAISPLDEEALKHWYDPSGPSLEDSEGDGA